MAKTNPVPQEHGRNAYLKGRCRCDEICRRAVREYSRDYDRKRGVKPSVSKPWTEEELELMRTSELNNQELTKFLPGRTYEAISRKRAQIGAGLIQRGIPVPHVGMRGRPAWNSKAKEKTPLPELVRGNRVKNIKSGKVYRICGVHLDSDPPYVWLDRTDTMNSNLLKRTISDLQDRYEGIS